MEELKRASIVPEMPDQYVRNPSIASLIVPSLHSEEDDYSMNELADRLLTDGTKVHRNYLNNC